MVFRYALVLTLGCALGGGCSTAETPASEGVPEIPPGRASAAEAESGGDAVATGRTPPRPGN